MTNKEKLDKAVEERLGLIKAANENSTHVQIAIEYMNKEKAKFCLEEFLSISKERNNEKWYEGLLLISKCLETHSKSVDDAKHYEAKSNYYEMMYNSSKQAIEENKIMREQLIKTL